MTTGLDTKEGWWLLARWEGELKRRLVPLVPKGVETYHLTMSTVAWCLGIIACSFFARDDIRWLWGVSAMILLQYLTDLLDGEIGRQRATGLIKWGYYMDHFLDYIFLCTIIIGYAIMLPPTHYLELLFILALFGAFMVNSFLSFTAIGKFQISYLALGPTEIRLLFIIVNTLLIIFGKTYLAFALPYVLIFSLIGLGLVVAKTQRLMWKLDMEIKKEGEKKNQKRSIKTA